MADLETISTLGAGTDLMLHTDQVIIGTDGADSLVGTSADDRILGLGGDDTLVGGGGDDKLLGGDGNDSILGGSGSDILKGGAGDDVINAPGVNDQVFGNAGDDIIRGIQTGSTTVHGGGGDDYILAQGSFSGAAGGSLNGDDGNDTIDVQVEIGSTGSWRLLGGAGADLMFANNEGGDTFDGGSGRDTIDGSFGSDIIHGGSGADLIYGTSGGDRSFGDNGNDTYRPEELYKLKESIDTFDGGAGSDTIDYVDATKAVFVDLEQGEGASQHTDTVSLVSVENAMGSDKGDILNGDGGANRLEGVGGKDQLDGRDGNDTLLGGALSDTLIGGPGQDRLNGGAGGDTYKFMSVDDSTNAAPDVIVKLQAHDVIDLEAIDADSTQDGDQAFTLVSKFDGHAGELTVSYDSANKVTLIQGDIDGDGVADFTIDAAHNHSGFTNFVL